MLKFYAVKNGKKTGIFLTWDECKEQVTGYKGAIYKSFKTKEEAEEYLDSKNIKEIENKNIDNVEKNDEVYAYIDGSFDRENKIYGSGVVIVDNEGYHEYKYANNKEEYAKLHNVAGELEAAKFVMWYAIDKKISEITLFYDYQGIESWATGEWKTNTDYTKEYAEFVKKVSTRVKLNFKKVKAHTGVELNELVDSLAKKAIEEFKIKNL